MVKLFVLKIDDNNADILLDKMSLLSCDEKSKADRFKYKKDKALSLGGRLILFCFANRYTDDNYVNLNIINDLNEFCPENMADFKIEYDELGKGYVNQESNLFYNISHSGDYVVCAFSNKNIGVDIQKIKPLKENFAKRFFNDKDNEYIMSDKNVDKDKMIRVWTAKESYSKLTGKGISGGFNGFWEDFDEMKIKDYKTNEKLAEILEFAVDSDYYCTVCSSL